MRGRRGRREVKWAAHYCCRSATVVTVRSPQRLMESTRARTRRRAEWRGGRRGAGPAARSHTAEEKASGSGLPFLVTPHRPAARPRPRLSVATPYRLCISASRAERGAWWHARRAWNGVRRNPRKPRDLHVLRTVAHHVCTAVHAHFGLPTCFSRSWPAPAPQQRVLQERHRSARLSHRVPSASALSSGTTLLATC